MNISTTTKPENVESTDLSKERRTDIQLLNAFLARKDELALTELIQRHSGMVMGVCRRYLQEPSDCDDAFQAVFLVFVKSASKIRKKNSLASWLYGVASRTAKRMIIERKKQEIATGKLMDALASEIDSPFEDLHQQYEQQIIDEEVNLLPDKYREPIIRHYFQGRSAPEIAKELNVTVGVIEGRLKRAKDKLRTRLIRRGVNASVFFAAASVLTFSSTAQSAVASNLICQTASLGVEVINQSIALSASSTVSTLVGKELAMMTTGKIISISACFVLPLAMVFSSGLFAEETGAVGSTKETPNITTTTALAGKAEEGEKSSEAELVLKNNRYGIKSLPTSKRIVDHFTRSPMRKKIESALDSAVQTRDGKPIKMTDIGIKSFLQDIAESKGVPIRFEEEAISILFSTEDGGDREELAVGEQEQRILKGMPKFSDSLDLLLEQAELDYVIKNNVLTIMTKEAAEEFLETRVYDVSHITDDSEELADIIEDIVFSPEEEGEEEGDEDEEERSSLRGVVRALPGSVIIKASQRSHRKVQALLMQLESLAQTKIR